MTRAKARSTVEGRRQEQINPYLAFLASWRDD